MMIIWNNGRCQTHPIFKIFTQSAEIVYTMKSMAKSSAQKVMTQKQIAQDYLALAQKYRREGRFNKALNALRVALNTYPKYAQAYNELGLVHRKLGESKEARAAYQKALRLNPKSSTAALNLGICYLYEEKEGQAIFYFKKAVQNDPHYGYAFFNLGSTYFDQAKYDLAIENLEKAIELEPTYLASYEICAMAHLILGNKDKAEHLYQSSEKFKRQARLKNVIG